MSLQFNLVHLSCAAIVDNDDGDWYASIFVTFLICQICLQAKTCYLKGKLAHFAPKFQSGFSLSVLRFPISMSIFSSEIYFLLLRVSED